MGSRCWAINLFHAGVSIAVSAEFQRTSSMETWIMMALPPAVSLGEVLVGVKSEIQPPKKNNA